MEDADAFQALEALHGQLVSAERRNDPYERPAQSDFAAFLAVEAGIDPPPVMLQ